VRYDHLLNFASQLVLYPFNKRIQISFRYSLLLVILRGLDLVLFQAFEALLDVYKFMPLVVGHLTEDHLIYMVMTVEYWDTTRFECIHVRTVLGCFLVGSEEVIDVLLSLLHHINVFR